MLTIGTFTDGNEWPKRSFFLFLLEVTLVRHLNIFTLHFEIDPAVWGFIFVFIVQYISLSLLCLKNLTFVSCGISVWFSIEGKS